ncbi:hypothetical protein Pla163_13940 [Planctomycetes bacterium Pla163]|uniref:Uncharacterized protein n=1 Tax=Rohdeia mirabilis TaxID=2528008 RepID=A0A518CYK7_9BACT|nr:hypothetical protein Pla163_13940 [Planctomycetes bacterium Pla163]
MGGRRSERARKEGKRSGRPRGTRCRGNVGRRTGQPASEAIGEGGAARTAGASEPPSCSRSAERPARDWGTLGAGGSAAPKRARAKERRVGRLMEAGWWKPEASGQQLPASARTGALGTSAAPSGEPNGKDRTVAGRQAQGAAGRQAQGAGPRAADPKPRSRWLPVPVRATPASDAHGCTSSRRAPDRTRPTPPGRVARRWGGTGGGSRRPGRATDVGRIRTRSRSRDGTRRPAQKAGREAGSTVSARVRRPWSRARRRGVRAGWNRGAQRRSDRAGTVASIRAVQVTRGRVGLRSLDRRSPTILGCGRRSIRKVVALPSGGRVPPRRRSSPSAACLDPEIGARSGPSKLLTGDASKGLPPHLRAGVPVPSDRLRA